MNNYNKITKNSKVTLTMEELDEYIEKKVKEKLDERLFTGEQLLKEPMIVSTSTSWENRSIDFKLENSIKDYKFLLISFGFYDNIGQVTNLINTLLIPVDEIKYNTIAEEARVFILAADDGSNFSSCKIYFKDDKTICMWQSVSSNSGRKYFAIDSIKGIGDVS